MGTEGTGEEFERHRRACFAAAQRMLGTVADAEDVVQETWLRWSGGDRSHVVDVRAHLVRTATHLALNRLRTLRGQRETYVGPWLPEPLVTSPDAEEPALLAESASTALLVVLEALSPLERAVFVLREVFEHPYRDIARTVHHSPGTVRQVARRARPHVHANRPRHRVDSATHWRATERFLAACRGGEVAELLRVLAPTSHCAPTAAGRSVPRAIPCAVPTGWRSSSPGSSGAEPSPAARTGSC